MKARSGSHFLCSLLMATKGDFCRSAYDLVQESRQLREVENDLTTDKSSHYLSRPGALMAFRDVLLSRHYDRGAGADTVVEVDDVLMQEPDTS